MPNPRVRVYTDYKSPYAFVANKRLFELQETHGVELEWLPYTLRVAEFMGPWNSARHISGARCATPIWTPGAMPMRKGSS
ncbi:hypothetical protein [Bradyrhizobium canariense]|uniref:hypothetical protein n=1 Tax=Bradyrhizobium canariense TaxID=255045 RepID=UPI001F0AFF14|nr:hypothetical protein [Bradyrhizobium canariense]